VNLYTFEDCKVTSSNYLQLPVLIYLSHRLFITSFYSITQQLVLHSLSKIDTC